MPKRKLEVMCVHIHVFDAGLFIAAMLSCMSPVECNVVVSVVTLSREEVM